MLSLDIDGNDLYLWSEMRMRPRILICEFNNAVPSELALTIPYKPDFSFTALSADQAMFRSASLAAFAAVGQATFPDAAHFLMIDDDEIASPDWLEQLTRAGEATGADVVGGPVLQRFGDDAKRGLQRHPAFRPAYDASGPVPIIYGCGNCLIKRSVFQKLGSPAFDLRFNFLGGGDVDFFTRCRRKGIKFHWIAEAVIIETVPDTRTRSSWIALRGLRIGAINYHVQRKVAQTPWLRARLAAKVLGMLPLSLVRAVRLFLTERTPLIAVHPMIVAAGGLLAAIGIEPQPYKASKITS